MHLPAGTPEWLGATPTSKNNVRGTNFAIWTPPDATRVEVCLFDKAEGATETKHLHLAEKKEIRDGSNRLTGYIWHGFTPGVDEGQLYGFRIDGPVASGYNPSKLQLDPKARDATGPIDHSLAVNHFTNRDDNGPVMPKSRVVDWRALPPGHTEWLGATPDRKKGGTNFVFYTSTAATGVELCLFDKARGEAETGRFDLRAREEVRNEEKRVAYSWEELQAMLANHQTGCKPDPVVAAIHQQLPAKPPLDGVPDDSHYLLVKLKDHTLAIICGHQDGFNFKPTHLTSLGKGGRLHTQSIPADTLPFDIRIDTVKVTPLLAGPAPGNPLEGAKIISGHVIGYLWHGLAKDVKEGALYGFRVRGPYNPKQRQFFNPAKLLVDPCAKAVTDTIHTWEPRHFPQNPEDNAAIMPKARVVDWQKLQRDATKDLKIGAIYPHADTSILELHVKGATILNQDIPEHERGKYKALSHPAFLNWLEEKGCHYTSFELMPIECFGTDAPLADKGKKNYWGYQTMAPTAAHTEYSSTDRPELELAQTIRALKQMRRKNVPGDKGIEVILDIVPNHTLESGAGGPVVNLRGMDDTLYLPGDYTGAGNTRDYGHPMNRRMLLEELHYWQGLGVAGYRFDLGTIMGREHGRDFDPDSPMMKEIRQDYGLDYGLKDLKFYGEAWDLGPHGYQIGRLAHRPPGQVGIISNTFTEWDDRVRKTLQQVALNPHANLPRSEIARAIVGSSDQYADPQNRLVKFGSHDGAPPEAMVTWRQKRNEANGEDNRDGSDGFANWGVEGPTSDVFVNGNRQRAQRFVMSLLAISQGVPMLVLGHDRGHSQDGNTNPYCQDNPINYIPWGQQIRPEGHELMDFNSMANQFRSKHFSLRRATHFSGKPDEACDLTFNGKKMNDLTWLDPMAGELKGGAMDWPGGFGMLLSGDPGNSPDGVKHFTRLIKRDGHDDPLLILVNPTMDDIEFTLPDVPGVKWKPVLNSLDPKNLPAEPLSGNQKWRLGHHALIAFEGQRVRDIAAGNSKHDGPPATTNGAVR